VEGVEGVAGAAGLAAGAGFDGVFDSDFAAPSDEPLLEAASVDSVAFSEAFFDDE
jgi:hypothetical protein